MDKVIELCNKHDITYSYEDKPCYATGIGDILFRFVCMKNNLFNDIFYINLNNFTKLYYRSDPINQLEFRILLIKDLCKYNNINQENIKFIFSNNHHICSYFPYELVSDFKLKLADLPLAVEPEVQQNIINEEYIIVHTKCRHNIIEDYQYLKDKVRLFCKNNVSKYKIIIMGERIFPNTEETECHGITTIYNELTELKHNNCVIDNSIENIYNNLDYNNYLNDIHLIKNAKYNICFGVGGQLSSSVIFGNSTIVYCRLIENMDKFDTEHFKRQNFHLTNIDEFLSVIKEKCFITT